MLLIGYFSEANMTLGDGEENTKISLQQSEGSLFAENLMRFVGEVCCDSTQKQNWE